jgi:thiol:disulfide interchange protein
MRTFVKRHALAIFCVFAAAHFASRPSLAGQILVMIALLVVLVSAVQFAGFAFTLWKHKDASRLMPSSFVIAGFVLGIVLGKGVREWNFHHELPSYDAAVRWASAQAKEDEIVVLDLPAEFSGLGKGVHVHKNSRCGLMVDFYWAGGFPVKHIVRRYAERPGFTEIPDCRKSWSGGRQLSDHWFELRD